MGGAAGGSVGVFVGNAADVSMGFSKGDDADADASDNV